MQRTLRDDDDPSTTMDDKRARELRARVLTWYDGNKRQLPWRREATASEGDEGDEGFVGEEKRGRGRAEDSKAEDWKRARAQWERLARGDDERAEGATMSDDQYAYGVWVSEIMSQQTQIERVAEYWTRWVQKWPTVMHLAQAKEDDVREQWAGLGYYRRSQFLLKGARYVLKELGGRFPRDIEGLLNIPGIGPYTAAAVGSIAFGLNVPAGDGNVNRVLTRVARIKGDPVKEKKTMESIRGLAKKLMTCEEKENAGRRWPR